MEIDASTLLSDTSWIPAYVLEGKKGLRQYVISKLPEDIPARNKRGAARAVIRNSLASLYNSEQFQQEVVDAILEKFTHKGDFGANRGEVFWYVTEDEGESFVGPSGDILGPSRTEGGAAQYDSDKLKRFLMKKTQMFAEKGQDSQKNKIVLMLIRKMSALEKENDPKFTRTHTSTRNLQESKKVDRKEENIKKKINLVLSKHKFHGEIVDNIDDLPKNVKKEDIRQDAFVNEKEMADFLKTIDRYQEFFGNHPVLRQLRLAILDFMEPKQGIVIIDTNIDEIIASLDLKDASRRERIYQYWEKVKDREKEVKEAIIDFQKSVEEIEGTDIDEELVKLNAKYAKVAERLLKQKKGKDAFSYLVSFDTNDDDYRSAMAIGRVADENMAGLQILADFNRERAMRDAIATREDFRGMSDEQLDMAFERSKIMESKLSPGTPTFDKEGKQTGHTRSTELSNAPTEGELEDISEGITTFLESVPDPLFYYVYMRGGKKSILNKMGLFSKEMKRIRNHVHYLARGNIVPRVVDIEGSKGYRDLERYLDRLEKEAIEPFENRVFHLPLSPNLIDQLNQPTQLKVDEEKSADSTNTKSLKDVVKYNDNNKLIGTLIQILAQYENHGDRLLRNAPPVLTRPKPGLKNNLVMAHGTQTTGRDTGENILPKTRKKIHKEFNKTYNALVRAVINYYLFPNYSRYAPFRDGGPEFMGGPYVRDLMTLEGKGEGSEGLRVVLHLENTYTYGIIDDDTIEKMTNILRQISSPRSRKNTKNLANQFESLSDVIVSELIEATDMDNGVDLEGYDLEEDVHTELGANLDRILQKNQITEQVEFAGQPSSYWNDKFVQNEKDGGRIYPLEAIISHLERMAEMYEDESPTQFRGGRLIMNAAKEFMQVFEKLHETIVKAEESKVLDAHDMIRKMQGKSVYHCAGKLDDFNDVDEVLGMLKEDYNTELTPFELETIVLDFDSHSNLSKKHGVSTEVIYFTKSMFR